MTKIQDIAILFFASYVISCSLNPIVDKLTQRMTRSQAAAVVLTGSLGIIFVFFLPIMYIGGYEIKSFINNFPSYIYTMKDFAINNPIINNTALKQLDFNSIISSATGFTTNVINNFIDISMEFASSIIYLIVACIVIYYFMADKEVVHKAYMSIFPKNMKDKAENILETISQKIGGYVIALIITITSVGLVMSIGLLILKVDYAILLGLLTAILDIIPVIGPAIALVIALIVGYKAGFLTMVLIFAVFCIAQLIENNFVRPLVFGKLLNIHPLIIYFFLLVTAQYLGVLGVILSPAIAATVCVLVEELYIKNIN